MKLGEPDAPTVADRGSGPHPSLPGLVGQAPLWLRACNEVDAVLASGEWLVVEGEPGVGKLALLRGVQLRRQPGVRLTVLDAADAAADATWTASVRTALADGAQSVVIRHVDSLDGPGLRALSGALRAAHRRDGAVEGARPPWVAVTVTQANGNADLAGLLRQFPSTVNVPPLRLHLDDLRPLVSSFLARLGYDGRLACSPEAMRLLMRSSWPGNVEQVHQVLRGIVQHRRAGVIRAADLPPQTQALSRRRLSPLESMERDAIVTSLKDSNGNKVQAARAVGMSRATIYRKIHEYGIIVPVAGGPTHGSRSQP